MIAVSTFNSSLALLKGQTSGYDISTTLGLGTFETLAGFGSTCPELEIRSGALEYPTRREIQPSLVSTWQIINGTSIERTALIITDGTVSQLQSADASPITNVVIPRFSKVPPIFGNRFYFLRTNSTTTEVYYADGPAFATGVSSYIPIPSSEQDPVLAYAFSNSRYLYGAGDSQVRTTCFFGFSFRSLIHIFEDLR